MKQFLKIRWPWILCGTIVISVLLFLLVSKGSDPVAPGEPTLTVETPQKLSFQNTKEFTLDVTVNQLGDARYPAMSMNLRFDASRLEFLGVSEGNVFVSDDKTSAGRKLPQWRCDVQNSNDTGRINVMYLDMTGGKHAFHRDLLANSDNVVLRLKFRLRGSVRAGDVLELTVEDAIFAASDETQSLAMTTNTLNVNNSKLVIGD